MRHKGKITNWNDAKGFGFITPFGGGKQIFIHINAFKKQTGRPKINHIVSYTISKDNQGRVFADNASRFGDKSSKRVTNKKGTLSIIVFFMFAILLSLSVLVARLPIILFAFYFVVSLITFIMYAVDKSAAQKGDRRTPESTLHFLSLAGGWPGALIAQQKLRHKSKKQSFRAIFWLTVSVNFCALIWLLTPNGNAILQSVIANIT